MPTDRDRYHQRFVKDSLAKNYVATKRSDVQLQRDIYTYYQQSKKNTGCLTITKVMGSFEGFNKENEQCDQTAWKNS